MAHVGFVKAATQLVDYGRRTEGVGDIDAPTAFLSYVVACLEGARASINAKAGTERRGITSVDAPPDNAVDLGDDVKVGTHLFWCGDVEGATEESVVVAMNGRKAIVVILNDDAYLAPVWETGPCSTSLREAVRERAEADAEHYTLRLAHAKKALADAALREDMSDYLLPQHERSESAEREDG